MGALTRISRLWAAGLLGAALMVSFAGAAGQEVDEAEARAFEIVDEWLGHLHENEAVQVQQEHSIELTMPDASLNLSETASVAVKRPNLFHINKDQYEGGFLSLAGLDDMNTVVVADGEHLYVVMPSREIYSQDPQPEPLTNAMDVMTSTFLADAFLVCDFFLEERPQDMTELRYGGESEVNGAVHHRIHARHDDIDLALFFTQEQPPILKRIEMEPPFEEGLQVELEEIPTIRFTFEDWAFDEDVDESLFEFEVPAAYERVDSVLGTILEDIDWPETPEPETPTRMEDPEPPTRDPMRDAQNLEQAQAPDFSLELLDGSTMTLSDHEGGVVVLDFWATWCPPCVRAMPILQTVMNDYADQGVAVYAVNLRETTEQVEQFLTNHGLDLPVAMDRDGAVAGEYLIRAVPTTVIVDREGVVAEVHVGAGPAYEDELREALDNLL
ncbi:MAG: redoxin domain-containing protein [Candidatus Hydrogenedentota bacterium]